MINWLHKILFAGGRTMNDKIRDCEYDNYPIPPYDPTLTPEERKCLQAEADAALETAIEEIKRKWSSIPTEE